MSLKYRIRLSDTDAAGRLYFASALRIAHEAFEEFMADRGFAVAHILSSRPFVLPVVHVDADYLRPLMLGDTVDVQSRVAGIGKRSVSFYHDLVETSGATAVRVTITHAVVAKKDGKAMNIPANLRRALSVG